MKRFLIILVLLLSGLSVPQAMAAASAHAETRIMAMQCASLVAKQDGEVLGCAARPKLRVGLVRTVAYPAIRPILVIATVHFGDRARE